MPIVEIPPQRVADFRDILIDRRGDLLFDITGISNAYIRDLIRPEQGVLAA